MYQEIKSYLYNLLADLVQTDTSVIISVWLIVCGVILFDSLYTLKKRKLKKVGLKKQNTNLKDIIKHHKILPGQNYISKVQKLSGRPDAVVVENSFIIPVERKPFAKKIRDRYIAQLLVYMRLIEEFEGKKPPYGYLILGKNSRRIKIDNTPERQAWLQTLIDEMNAIIEHDAKAIPSPNPSKCSRCSIRYACDFSVVKKDVVKIGKKINS